MTSYSDRIELLGKHIGGEPPAPDAAFLEAHLRQVQAREAWNQLERRLNELLDEPAHVRGGSGWVSESLGQPGTASQRASMRERALRMTQPITSVMNPHAPVCRDSDSLNDAARQMWDHGVALLPVVNEALELVGLLSERDVAMGAYTQGRRLAEIDVSSAMVRSSWSCVVGETCGQAIAKIKRSRLHALPVVNPAGHVVGTVSEQQLRAVASEI